MKKAKEGENPYPLWATFEADESSISGVFSQGSKIMPLLGRKIGFKLISMIESKRAKKEI